MSELPTHLIESSRYGYNSVGRHRLGYGDRNVRRSLQGILGRYPDARIRILSLPGLDDVSWHFLVGRSAGSQNEGGEL